MSILRALIRGMRTHAYLLQEPVADVAVATECTHENRVSLDQAAADIRDVYRDVAADYQAGAFASGLADPELRHRFEEVERTLDGLACTPGGPHQRDWNAAVGRLVAVLNEVVARYWARHDRQDRDERGAA